MTISKLHRHPEFVSGFRKLHLVKFLASLLIAISISGCAGKVEGDIIGDVPSLYNKGMDEMQAKTFLDAIRTFEELERQHPYSGWATKAQEMVVYAYFRRGDYDESLMAGDRFERAHPGHEDIPYILYLRGLSFYNRITDIRRDQGMTLDALKSFEGLVNRFPASKYSKDARLKITLCKDHLAGQEMEIGRFYHKKGRYSAAINRYQYVVDNYQTTSHSAEALYRLTESYLALGIIKEAKRAAAILGHNFPSSDWYKDAYKLMQEAGQ